MNTVRMEESKETNETKKRITADDVRTYYGRVRTPHIRNLFKFTQSTIVFDGYFYLEPELFSEETPVKRIIGVYDQYYYIAITKRESLENTSKYFDDEEHGRICLFPTEIIRLTYRLLERIPSHERVNQLKAEMEAVEDALIKANDAVRREKDRKESERMQEKWKTENLQIHKY